VLDADEEFYFKPDAGRILASPADETPVEPCDVQPEEMDIAITVDRIETATALRVGRIASRWAGLRSFVADKVPVVGVDPQADGFYWLAGQGGYGIMTSPALSEIAAALILGAALPDYIAALGVRTADLSPERLRAPRLRP
jgi:D-arginine dehydrogenase